MKAEMSGADKAALYLRYLIYTVLCYGVYLETGVITALSILVISALIDLHCAILGALIRSVENEK